MVVRCLYLFCPSVLAVRVSFMVLALVRALLALVLRIFLGRFLGPLLGQLQGLAIDIEWVPSHVGGAIRAAAGAEVRG